MHDTQTEVDASFDRYARLVRRTVGVPVGLVTVVEGDRQVFLGALGLPEPYQSSRQTPLSHSFCQYVVADGAPLVVSDARLDERLRDNLAITDLHVVAYAGWPLRGAQQQVIGSLCAIHDEPHAWSDLELENLADFAAACSAELAQRELAEGLSAAVVELSGAVEELEASNERLAAFAGQVSHDLRNPLAAMVSSLELLDELRDGAHAEDGSPMDFVLARARRSTSRMAALVHEVLEHARIGAEMDLGTVDVAAVVAAAVEDLDIDPAATPLTTGRLDDVRAHAVQLRIVVQNLIANAVKHAPGSPIEVVTDRTATDWRLQVVDHGPGIDAAQRSRVLESLVQLDPGAEGWGLGLATCARIVRAHQGSLTIEETPRGGTTVTVTLPQQVAATVGG